MNLGNVLVRPAKIAEFQKILDFYEENQSENLSSREPAQLFKIIQEKKAFIIVNQEDEIVAAGCIFEYLNGDYREGGATVVSSRYQGFHFQNILIGVRFLHEEVLNPDYKIFFSTVFESSPSSIHNLKTSGFVQKSPDENVKQWKSFEESKPRRYYELSRSKGRKLAGYLLELEENSLLTRKKDSATINLSFDLYILKGPGRKILEAFK